MQPTLLGYKERKKATHLLGLQDGDAGVLQRALGPLLQLNLIRHKAARGGQEGGQL